MILQVAEPPGPLWGRPVPCGIRDASAFICCFDGLCQAHPKSSVFVWVVQTIGGVLTWLISCKPLIIGNNMGTGNKWGWVGISGDGGQIWQNGMNECIVYHRCSMYGILTYIYPLNYPNVGFHRPYIECTWVLVWNVYIHMKSGILSSWYIWEAKRTIIEDVQITTLEP